MANFEGNLMSKALGMETSLTVYLPHDDEKHHKNKKPMRTLILLHGYSGNHSVWHRFTALERYAADANLAVITPDGGVSMYADMAYGQNYFEYISSELIETIDRMFHVPTDREHLMIGGLSMGGYGALKTAFTYPDRFSKCVAFSSATMLGSKEFLGQLRKAEDGPMTRMAAGMIGAFGNGDADDSANDLYALAGKLSGDRVPEILMTCGRQDSLFEENKRFYHHLRECGIPAEWKEWDGAHEWNFWDASIKMAIEEFL